MARQIPFRSLLCYSINSGKYTKSRNLLEQWRLINTYSTYPIWSSMTCTNCKYNFSNCQQMSIRNFSSKSDESARKNVNQQKPMSNLVKYKKRFVIAAHRHIVNGYSLLTLPLYAIRQDPSRKIYLQNVPKAKKSDTVPNGWVNALTRSSNSSELIHHKLNTLEKVLTHAFTNHSDKPCLGSRPILKVETVVDATGISMHKKELGPYEWKTYGQVDEISSNLSKSLVNVLNLSEQKTIAIFADTREEWLITAIAAFKCNLSIVAIDVTLSDDQVTSALNQTAATCVFTTKDLMPRCQKILNSTQSIKQIIYMKTQHDLDLDLMKFPQVKVMEWSSLVNQGAGTSLDLASRKPSPDDTAVIAFADGSTTKVPKAVVLSHENVTSAMIGVADLWHWLAGEKDTYMAVVSLADITELSSEVNAFLHGAKIGYATLSTLSEDFGGLKDTKGDATMLRPTITTFVPPIVEKIMQQEYAKLAKDTAARQEIIGDFFKFKMSWIRKGYETHLLDRLLFSKMKKPLGGAFRRIICAGPSAFDPKTQELFRAIFCVPLVPSYGHPETGGFALASVGSDLSVGRSGGPIHGVTAKLVDSTDGNYKVTDKPNPRGEVYISGRNIAKYLVEGDGQEFFNEGDQRWFKTGNIAEVDPDGVFRIIEWRKKSDK